MSNHPVHTLNNGVTMPVLGLGVFRVPEQKDAEDAVRTALQAGYRHIDTAAIYGNEEGVGRGIRASGVPRDQIFLTTKLWNEAMRQGRQREAFEESLKKLGTDYVDLYLVHWPVPGKFVESWQVVEALYRAGRIRAAGVSNFHRHHLDAVAQASSLVPAVNQIELHPYLNQVPLVDECIRRGIAVTAWSPLGGVKRNVANDPVLKEIGGRYGKSAVQVTLRWQIQRGLVTIPKSSNPGRIAENAAVFDFELTPADLAAIHGLNEDFRVGSDPDNFTF